MKDLLPKNREEIREDLKWFVKCLILIVWIIIWS